MHARTTSSQSCHRTLEIRHWELNMQTLRRPRSCPAAVALAKAEATSESPRPRARSRLAFPSCALTRRRASVVSACRTRSVGRDTTSPDTRSGVKSSLNQLEDDARAGDEIRHRIHVYVHEPCQSDTSTAKADRRRPRPLVHRTHCRRRAGRRDHHVRGRDHLVRPRTSAAPADDSETNCASAIVAARATVNCAPGTRESAASRPRTPARCARLRCGGCRRLSNRRRVRRQPVSGEKLRQDWPAFAASTEDDGRRTSTPESL